MISYDPQLRPEYITSEASADIEPRRIQYMEAYHVRCQVVVAGTEDASKQWDVEDKSLASISYVVACAVRFLWTS